MKRSARILKLARNCANKENSCDLFDSTLPSNQKNKEEVSLSSPDVSDTDSNYTPPIQDTTSDESCIDDDRILDKACSLGFVLHASTESQNPQKNNSLIERKPLSNKNIEQSSYVKTSLISNDSVLSHISNSPCDTFAVDIKF
ncbi:uncharacterized protein LOC119188933 [Manduca sexta]|uniref:uncharacterized protein LOC119188933 n=1 Tax=Manduca sexta TaxID=7130 RepID=UPI00188EC033|nr:uncharacterized protein LOC119188933 [Manduca sexta]